MLHKIVFSKVISSRSNKFCLAGVRRADKSYYCPSASVRCPSRFFGLSVSADGQMRTDGGRTADGQRTDADGLQTDGGRTANGQRTDDAWTLYLRHNNNLLISVDLLLVSARIADGRTADVHRGPSAVCPHCPCAVRLLSVRCPSAVRPGFWTCLSAVRTECACMRTDAHGCERNVPLLLLAKLCLVSSQGPS